MTPIRWTWAITVQGTAEPNYHGTKCAGIIGAVGNNGKGVAGINWSVQIMALRITDVDQSIGNAHAFIGDAVEAFNYLIQQRRRGVNIRVTSNSYGRLRQPSVHPRSQRRHQYCGHRGYSYGVRCWKRWNLDGQFLGIARRLRFALCHFGCRFRLQRLNALLLELWPEHG